MTDGRLRSAARWGLVATMAAIGVLVMGVAQTLALRAGMDRWVDWHALIDWLIALALGFMPVIGPVGGGAGAVSGWGWPVAGGIALAALSIAIFTVSALARGRLAQIASALGAGRGGSNGRGGQDGRGDGVTIEHEAAGHEAAGHEAAEHEAAGHEAAGHEAAGQPAADAHAPARPEPRPEPRP